MNPQTDAAGSLFEQQVQVAFLVALCLPVGLLLLASWRSWLDAAEAAVGARRTRTSLWGAGLVALAVVAAAIAWSAAALRPVAVLIVTASVANFCAGFAVGARAQGRAMLRREDGAPVLVWGWIARAGVFAVPLVGVALGAYFVALAFGTPFVAFLYRPKSTTAPSAGSDADL